MTSSLSFLSLWKKLTSISLVPDDALQVDGCAGLTGSQHLRLSQGRHIRPCTHVHLDIVKTIIKHKYFGQTGLRICITLMRSRIQFFTLIKTDPDPAFHFNGYPDPAPRQIDGNLRPQVYRPWARDPFWASRLVFLSVHGPPRLFF
jgi:hypothetical protein